jgi:hypothetical protein
MTISENTTAFNPAISPEAMRAWLKDKANVSRSKQAPEKHKRKSGFEPQFIQLPVVWIKRLHAASVTVSTYKLAHVILVEKFKLDQMAIKEIVLSREVTGLKPDIRRRAIANLVRLKLIRVRRRSTAATRVIDLFLL